MKYRIIEIKKEAKAPKKRTVLKRKGHKAEKILLPTLKADMMPSERCERSDTTVGETAAFFDFGSYYDPYLNRESKKAKKINRPKRWAVWFAALGYRTRKTIETKVSKIREKRLARAARPQKPSLLPALAGALCSLVLVSAVSFGAVIYKFLIKGHVSFYDSVSVPELVGGVYPVIETDLSKFELEVNYVYDDSAALGVILEQTPSAGARRRVYRRGDPCKITLTVSLGEKKLTMRDYVSKNSREALLDLKNQAVKVELSQIYSDIFPEGVVISTVPSVGESFSASETVTLVVSRGKEIKYGAVPDVCGLGEVKATEILRAAGFEIGKIAYVSSDMAAGRVVSQSILPFSSLALGASVDLTVSTGALHTEKTVPDLSGLTVDEARERLAEVGLVIGRIYSIQNGDKKNTVLLQSVAAGTPIYSGIVSVDIYVGS